MSARERSGAEALEVALRALEHRDRSTAELRGWLERRGIASGEREHALERLSQAGLVDDGRFALNRATALAGRGYGNAAIEADLERRGIAPELVAAAIAGLEPETARATEIALRRGRSARTARFLAGKGFGMDALETACGVGFANDP